MQPPGRLQQRGTLENPLWVLPTGTLSQLLRHRGDQAGRRIVAGRNHRERIGRWISVAEQHAHLIFADAFDNGLVVGIVPAAREEYAVAEIDGGVVLDDDASIRIVAG